MKTYVVVGMKPRRVGTKNELVPTGHMVPEDPNELGWAVKMIPQMEWKLVPWVKDMPTVLGIFSFDPTELCKTRFRNYNDVSVFFFEDEDVVHHIPDYTI